jgi:tRNA modification GTPase
VNAGKSSLMNALLGFNRSITSQVAGTTRDAVSAKTVISGWPVMLIDTAGIRETSNPIERDGISRMQSVVADSDLLLLVTDVGAEQTDHLQEIAEIPQNVPVIHVVSKMDLVDEQTLLRFQQQPDCVPVSAKTGVGLDQLNDEMMCKLHKQGGFVQSEVRPSQTPLVFTERQYSHLFSIRKKLEQGEIASNVAPKSFF